MLALELGLKNLYKKMEIALFTGLHISKEAHMQASAFDDVPLLQNCRILCYVFHIQALRDKEHMVWKSKIQKV